MKRADFRKRALRAYLLFSMSLATAPAQQPAISPSVQQSPSSGQSVSATLGDSQVRKGNPSEISPPVRIGPGDDLDITVFGLPELSEHARVGNSGDISLPLIGNVHLAGLSGDEAQAVIARHLVDGHFVNNPNVSVYVREYTTEGISVIGEVNKPGVYSALGPDRLVDLVQTAGGLTDKAGKTITITHRDDPKHPITLTWSNDGSGMAENNIQLLPGDTVVISKAGIVYVVGEVNRPGGFVITDNKMTASQVLVMAAGPTSIAALNRAKMIRRTPEGLKDLPLPLKKVLQAKVPDMELQPDDIIWIPSSRTKTIASQTTSTIIGSAATLAIYHPF